MQRALVSPFIAAAALLLFGSLARADSGVVTDARVGLQDSHGWVSPQTLQRYGTVRGLSVVFEYTFAAETGQGQQPYDFHQVRYSINRSPERQISPVDAHRFVCCLAQPGAHYVFKVQGCRKGTFGSDCTAWFERDFDTPPDATPRPPAPAPRTRPPTPRPTPRRVGVPNVPTPAPTPVPFAINAPKVALAAVTPLQCGRMADPAARTECITNARAGKVHVTWSWQKSPCNAVTCYDAEGYVVGSGAERVTLGAAVRSAWARPDAVDGCVEVDAVHNLPRMLAAGSACLPTRPVPGKPQ